MGSHATLLIGLGILSWQAVLAGEVAAGVVARWATTRVVVGAATGGLVAQGVGGTVGGLPQVGGPVAGALGKAGVCTAATLTFLELLKRVFGQTRADTDIQSRRPDRIIVSHYTSEAIAQEAMASGVLKGVGWEGHVFVMEGRSSFKRAAKSGAQLYEVRIVFEALKTELAIDPEIKDREELVRRGQAKASDIITEARYFIRPGPVSLMGRNPVIEHQTFWDRP